MSETLRFLSQYFKETLRFFLVPFEELPGWGADPFDGVKEGLESSAHFFETGAKSWSKAAPLSCELLKGWQEVFDAKSNYDLTSPLGLRSYLEAHFQCYRLETPDQKPGLLTGYYHPHVAASRIQKPGYEVPLYRRPPELVIIEDGGLFSPKIQGQRFAGMVKNGNLVPYFTRQEIEEGALAGRGLEIAWVKDPTDAFFMMIQGSGTLMFDDSPYLTLHYGGANGYPFTSLGRLLIERGVFTQNDASAMAVKAWLQKNGDAARRLMWENKSYIFFEPSPATHKPLGACGVPLACTRSLACDPYALPLGAPVWVDTSVPWQEEPYQRLMFAHDVGSAIKGEIRADLYCGQGDEAFLKAGSLKHPGTLYLLWPRALSGDVYGA
ncbi:MAG: MltA domain-containing protein [Alphaproteobacteria bacterium]|nr:MltA domain-containing protein [Alphaproteobacteria bacterium]